MLPSKEPIRESEYIVWKNKSYRTVGAFPGSPSIIYRKMTTDKRAFSLDALRGYAILTMVLSGTVASGILPGWMYHAQLPPPTNQFNPAVFGITWVDLVFPFFLFAMGAAFPFSIGKKAEKGISKLKLVGDALLRGIQLTFFAIYIQHIYPWIISSPQDVTAWCISLGGFLLMFPMFMRLPLKMPEWAHIAVKACAYASGIILLLTLNYANDRQFSLGFSNIIILVLANMAIFGSLIYIFTLKNRLARIAVLPFVMAVFLGSATEGSWVRELFNFSPLPWMYKFYYLKYLFIVIPGSIAGEYLLEWMRHSHTGTGNSDKRLSVYMIAITLGLVICNLVCLYSRWLVANLFLSTVLLAVGLWLLRDARTDNAVLWRKLFRAGTYLLVLGLFFEAYEGGIRKDHSTYSYYFTTSGLAFMALLFFNVICDYYKWLKATKFLVMPGQNPMIAYVATNLFVMPLLNLTGLASFLSLLADNAWLGFLRGVVLTSLAMLTAMFFTRIKWFWRT